MKIRQIFQKLMLQEDLNFLLTNRIPRITLTRFMGWWSQIRHPWVVQSSMAVWRMFSDLDLSEAKSQKFDSLHACFTRELRPGARVVNPDPTFMTSPCDAIVGACGTIKQGQVFQAKGFSYQLETLLGSSPRGQHWPAVLEGGTYLTLRLTSSMYHRFHAPDDVQLQHVTYISGDTWNVNPVALARVQELFCKNERAVLHMKTQEGVPFLIVPVAAVLVASMRAFMRSMCCSICATRAPMKCPVTPITPRAKKWAGLSTAPPFWSLFPKALLWQMASRRVSRFEWDGLC